MLVQLVWVSLAMFCSVGFSWFVLFCLGLFDLQSVSHLFFVCCPSIYPAYFCLVLSCSWCAMVGMVVVALDLFWFGFGSVKWCLSWFCIQSWLTWSHFLLLNGHSQQPQTECTIRFRLKGETYLFTHLFTSVLMPHWYTTAVRPINVTPPINVIVPHKCHSASHKCHSSP